MGKPDKLKRTRMMRIMVTPREEREWRKAADTESEGNVSSLVRDTMNNSKAIKNVREAQAAAAQAKEAT